MVFKLYMDYGLHSLKIFSRQWGDGAVINYRGTAKTHNPTKYICLKSGQNISLHRIYDTISQKTLYLKLFTPCAASENISLFRSTLKYIGVKLTALHSLPLMVAG